MILKKKLLLLVEPDDEFAVKMTKILYNSKLFNITAIICTKKNKKKYKNLSLIVKKNTKFFFDGFPHKNKKIIKFINKEKIKLALCLSFPNLIRQKFISLFESGILNFHPAYLPYNKGSHSAFWSIMNNTPYGATLHLMNKNFDSGPIVDRIKKKFSNTITADRIFIESRQMCIELLKRNLKNIYNNFFFKLKNKDSNIYFKKNITKVVNLDLKASIKIKKLWALLRAVHYKKNGIFFKIKNKKFKVIPSIEEI
jgi:methionyl-tRNA formyltransferase